MAMDLQADSDIDVTVADLRPQALARLESSYGVGTQQADLADAGVVRRLVADYDIVLGALSSVIGLQTLQAVVEAGKDYCDISFMAEDALQVSALAEKNGVTAVVDCGVAPGMSNMLAGYAASVLDPCERLEIYVGGLPVQRHWPFEYKAGFAPHDVLEEYVRPARIVEGGKVVVREALSEPQLIDFPEIGTLEAFNTDGLRSLVDTLDVPDMLEKTMRYPGHIELMRVFRETGLFSKDPIQVGDQTVRPLDLTAQLLFPKWTFEEGEADLTVMRVVGIGNKDGKPTKMTWDLLDYYDPETKFRSMSRTTAFPATIMARMILGGRFNRPGVFAPEVPGQQGELVDEMLAELRKRGVRYTASVE
jgi:saccharopine dehydrogenase-like NADP-dependent oxidoreductase